MDWSSRQLDFCSLILRHQPQLLMLMPILMEFKLMRTEFSSIKVSKQTGLLNGDTLTSLCWVSGLAGLYSHLPTISFCHPSSLLLSSQEDGPNRDTSPGTLSSCHTQSKLFSTSHSCLDKFQSTSLISKILRKFHKKPSKITLFGPETYSTKTWCLEIWRAKSYLFLTSKAYGTSKLSSTPSCIESNQAFI
jgi:hypothetical protein